MTKGISRTRAAAAVLALLIAPVALVSTAAASTPKPAVSPAPATYATPAGCNSGSKTSGGKLVARCFAMVRTGADHQIRPSADGPPSAALGPPDIRNAYRLPDGGDGQTVAIVDAFGDSRAEADLGVFRAQYGLPACTTDNGCFTKVDQRGGTSYPKDDSGWALETALDLDAVSAGCPKCHILLVQGDDNTLDSLAAAVDTAVQLGAKYVSNSYGVAGEVAQEVDFDKFYSHQGVAVVASSGDQGAVSNWPATNPDVLAVGGTTLTRDASSSRGWTEKAWGNASGGDGGGSGCSPYEPHPDYQDGIDTACDNRAIADVSADADPASGLAVYDTLGQSGWLQVGGTSLSSPLLAAMFALAGPPRDGTFPVNYPYDNAVDASTLNDVTTGANGGCGTVLCQAGPGWDGPTGLGTPNGVSALTFKEHGDVVGTVTDSATGSALAGADVKVGARTARTDEHGQFHLNLPIGDYPVTVTDYAYQDATGTVTVTAGQTTTHDVALTPIPRRTVSGTVTDASGHGWGLYAKVTSADGAGHDQSTFTDPATGHYALSLPQNATYTLHVTAQIPGYNPAERAVQVGTADLNADVGVTIDPLECTAPGYHEVNTGGSQSFDDPRTPTGWRVVNNDPRYPGYTATPGWVFTNPGTRTNDTGGAGNFAIVDSDQIGAHHVQDTSLITPAVDMSIDDTPVIRFASDLKPAVNSTAAVDVSTDNGRTWTNVWTRTGFPEVQGRQTVALPQAAHQRTVRVRFHYLGSWSQWWQLDDVFLGGHTCAATDGGLIIGNVGDSTGTGITGATVTAGTEHTTTIATPDDPALGDGFYVLFTPAGQQQVTATKSGFAGQTTTATVTSNHVTRQDFTLTTG